MYKRGVTEANVGDVALARVLWSLSAASSAHKQKIILLI